LATLNEIGTVEINGYAISTTHRWPFQVFSFTAFLFMPAAAHTQAIPYQFGRLQ
jgi:hypothetical protein